VFVYGKVLSVKHRPVLYGPPKACRMLKWHKNPNSKRENLLIRGKK
jgi:hypothetical protein